MQNIGEEIVGVYLQEIKKCDFIQYNLHNPDIQGEIDVIGINMGEKFVYICEVAIHLITGFQYTKNKRPDRINRLIKKFEKDIDYAEKYFKNDYKKIYMFWSPIVKNSGENTKYNQLKDVQEIKRILDGKKSIDLQIVINEDYMDCLKQLRKFASEQTKALESPVLRLMQIEEKLKQHLNK